MKKHIERLLGNIFLPLFLCAALLAGCAGSNASALLKEYDLGVRYLSEGNYEEAVISFTKAIEIDEKYADAYLGRAQAYVGLGTEEDLAKAQQDYATAADLYEEQGDTEKAEQVRDEAQTATEGNNGSEAPSPAPGTENVTAQSETYDLHDGRYYIEDFNADGVRFRGTLYDADGNTVRVDEYAADNVKVKETIYRDGAVWYYNVYEYDARGNLIKDSVYHIPVAGMPDNGIYNPENGLDQIATFEYDEKNNLVCEERYDWDGSLLFRATYEYDESGNMVKKSGFNGEQGQFSDFFSMQYYSIYEYDQNGNEVKSEYYDPDGSLNYYCTREYDESGREIRTNTYKPSGALNEYTISEYDAVGNAIKRIAYWGDDSMNYYTVYEYDRFNSQINQHTYEPDGSEFQGI